MVIVVMKLLDTLKLHLFRLSLPASSSCIGKMLTDISGFEAAFFPQVIPLPPEFVVKRQIPPLISFWRLTLHLHTAASAGSLSLTADARLMLVSSKNLHPEATADEYRGFFSFLF